MIESKLLNYPFKLKTKSRLSKSFSLHLCGIPCNNFYILHHDYYSKGMLSSGVDGDPGRMLICGVSYIIPKCSCHFYKSPITKCLGNLHVFQRGGFFFFIVSVSFDQADMALIMSSLR